GFPSICQTNRQLIRSTKQPIPNTRDACISTRSRFHSLPFLCSDPLVLSQPFFLLIIAGRYGEFTTGASVPYALIPRLSKSTPAHLPYIQVVNPHPPRWRRFSTVPISRSGSTPRANEVIGARRTRHLQLTEPTGRGGCCLPVCVSKKMARGNINPRTIVAPMAAFTMACVLFAYTRSSIQAAKVNAKINREAQQKRAAEQSRGATDR
ncbi:hypothetical protein B0T22DRAFT_307917, partial [Podospora appendiculata]